MAEKRFKPGEEGWNAEAIKKALAGHDITPETSWAEYSEKLRQKREPVSRFIDFVIAKAEARNRETNEGEDRLDLGAIPEIGREGMAEFIDESGKEIFRKLAGEAIDILVTHGTIEKKEDGTFRLKTFSDLDGKACLYLCKLAGIKANPTFVEPGGVVEGALNVDTSGREGVEFDPDSATLYIDHHGEFSPTGTSAAEYLYDTLWRAGLVEPSMSLEGAIEFVTAMDNGEFQNRYDLNTYLMSDRTLVGLANYLNFQEIVSFFADLRNDPMDPLSNNDLAKWHRGKRTSLRERAERREAELKRSLEEVLKLREEGFEVESPILGNILVDVGKRAPFGREAALSLGYDVYLAWNPEENSFFVQSKKELGEKFGQGVGVRGRMWIKPRNEEELTVSLNDILGKLTGGQLEVKGKLAEYLEEEAEKGVEKTEKGEEEPETDKVTAAFLAALTEEENEEEITAGTMEKEPEASEAGLEALLAELGNEEETVEEPVEEKAEEESSEIEMAEETPTIEPVPSVEREAELVEQTVDTAELAQEHVEETGEGDNEIWNLIQKLREETERMEREEMEKRASEPLGRSNELYQQQEDFSRFKPGHLLRRVFWGKTWKRVKGWFRRAFG